MSLRSQRDNLSLITNATISTFQTGDISVTRAGAVTCHQSAADCGARGDHITLPYSSISSNTSSLAASHKLGDNFLRMMYGVWTSVTSDNTSLSNNDNAQQYSRCWGKSAHEVILSHSDFTLSRNSAPVNMSRPVLTITRYSPPRYMIVLENSAMMGSQWDLVRTVIRNLILETEYLPSSAQLGLVMFNSAAYTEHPLVPLSQTNRQSLSLSIRSKHNLSPSTDSCVTCGINKAVEALHGSPGVIILISRGTHTQSSQSSESKTNIWSIADKHQLRVFSVIIPPLGQRSVQQQIVRAADSFIVNSTASYLAMYRQCLHVTDTILRSTLMDYRAVVSLLQVTL